MTREELIAALSSAAAEQQDECVRRSLRLAVACGWISAKACEFAMRMCDVGAYESAALVLVPETDGRRWYEVGQAWSQAVARVRVYPPSPWEGRTRETAAEAATPALALAAAALKAQGGGE